MRAAILRSTGDTQLELADDVEVPDPAAGQVLVKITHTGLCHSDVSAMNGTLPVQTPAVLGHEGAGIVDSVGPGVTSVAPGDHVIVVWSPPCGSCIYCTGRKQPNLCTTLMFTPVADKFRQGNTVLGAMAGAGTFAEYCVLLEQAVVKIPDDVPLDVASLIGCGVMTGVGASINTAKVTVGSSVVVFGAGGVGISAIQGARMAGAAEIVAVDINPDKLAAATRFGATHAVTPDQLDDAKMTVTGGDGFDFALECIGNATVMRTAYDMTRRGGTTCIVGVGRADQILPLSAFELFFNEKTLVGSYYGGADTRTDFHRLLGLWRTGKLDLEGMITRRLTLDQINDGIDQMLNGNVVRQVIAF